MRNFRSLALIGILALAIVSVSCEDEPDVYQPTANTELKSGKAIKKSDASIADIVVAAADAGEFTVLKSLLVQYDLVGVFAGTDQYTVLAPTDAAFDALFAYLGENNITLSDEQIVNTLLYHVTDGRRAAYSVLPKKEGQMKTIETLLGQSFSVDMYGKIHTASMGMSSIITAGEGAGPGVTYNISASNGIVHVIDAVLVPEL